MLRRLLLPLVLLVAAAPQVRAQDAPTVVVRIRSLDTLTDNIKLLVALAGREEIAQQVEGLIKTKIGAKGLEGIDPGRPVGAYARIGKDLEEVSGVALVPIADEKAFLTLLENLNFPATKGKNDVYTIRTGTAFDLYFRFANKYAYVTALNPGFIDDNKLLTPDKVFPANQTAAISAVVRLDQVPDAAKLIALAQMEQELANAQQKDQPGESPTQKALRVQVLKEVARVFGNIVKDGSQLQAEIDINKQTSELSVNLSLSGQPRSELAESIANIGQLKSVFAGIGGAAPAVRGGVHVILPPTVQKSFNDLIEETRAKALASIQDAAKRKQAETLFDALMPTLKTGEVDAALVLQGPNKDRHLTLLAGIKLKDGDKLGKTVHDLVLQLMKDIPPAEAAKIKLEADTAGAVKIHRLDFGGNLDKNAREAFGEHPIYVAFRNDAAFLALGPDGLSAIKDAVTGKNAGTNPPVHLEIALAKLAPLLAKTDDQRDTVAKVFRPGDDGKIRFTIDGGSSLKLHFTTKLSVVGFFSQFVVKGEAKFGGR